MIGKHMAFIPAKAKSRRLPSKNLALLGGKPLLFYTLEVAQQAKIFDKIVVSTDNEQIANLAQKAGAEIPFLRPLELAMDRIKVVDVLYYTLIKMQKELSDIKTICVLLPTCPLRTVCDISNTYKIYFESGAYSLVSITDYELSPYFALELDKDGRIKRHFKAEGLEFKSQFDEVPHLFRPNGAICIIDKLYFLKYKNFYGDNTVGYFMPRERSIDIDEPVDLIIAESLLHQSQNFKK